MIPVAATILWFSCGAGTVINMWYKKELDEVSPLDRFILTFIAGGLGLIWLVVYLTSEPTDPRF